MTPARLFTLPFLAVVALLLPAAAAASTCADADLMPQPGNLDRIARATRCLINQQRVQYGRRRLTVNGQLDVVAQGYAQKLVNEQFFSHVGLDGSTLLSRIRRTTTYLAHRVSYALGENLAWGSGSYAPPSQIVESWMESPGHRRNILDRSFRDIGIGITAGAPQDTDGLPAATYVTEFGRRG